MNGKIFLALSFALLIVDPAVVESQEGHYRIYTNLSTTEIGAWTKTEIQVPRGALIAVMSQGEVRNYRNPRGKRCPPSRCFKFRIGEGGQPRGLSRYYRDSYVEVIKSQSEGAFYYGIGLRFREVRNKKADIRTTIIVWDKRHLDKVEMDIRDLILAHPEDRGYQALLFPFVRFLTLTGEYSRAERVLKGLRESMGKEGREAAIAWNLSSENEKWLGRYEKVKTYSEETLLISRREGYGGIEVAALLSLAEALAHLGETEQAIKLAEEALEMSADIRPAYNFLSGRAHQTLGFLNLYQNRVPEAVEHCEKAVQFLRKARAWRPLAQAYFLLGLAQWRSNLPDRARMSYLAAIRMAEPLGRLETLWRAHSQLGHLAEKRKDWKEAFEHYAEAIKIIEATRGELEDPALKSVFMENKIGVYEWMIRLLLKLDRDEEALYYLERAKARIMLDMLRDKTFSSKNEEENRLLARERALRKEMQELVVDLAQVSPQDMGEMAEEEGDLQESGRESIPELDRVRRELESVLERIERLNPDLASLLTASPLTAKEIQGLLDEDTAILAYFIGSNVNVVFVVTRGKVLTRRVAGSREAIAEKVMAFRKETVEGVSLERLMSKVHEKPLGELYEMLIRPVESEIEGMKHLVVVPHGILHYLPFQTLRSPRGYLLESFTISYLPSASVLKYARAKNKGNRSDILAVANPVTDLAPIPEAEVEAKEVSLLFENRLVLTGPKATETAVKAEGPRYDLVLFSTHGEMIEADPLKSNLRFTPSQEDDGRFTVKEIFDMEVKANLVTLSACETGLAQGLKGGFPKGDDLVGLSRAFIHAGAPSVVASLWKVSDDSTVALMRSFYQNLKTMEKGEALRQAQLQLIRSGLSIYSHPFYWGPFILVGDWK